MKRFLKKIKSKKNYFLYVRLFLNILFFIPILSIIYLPQERFGKGLKEGGISPVNLYSPIDLIVKTEIDEEKTKGEKQKARESVLDVYDYDISKIEYKVNSIKDLLSQLKDLEEESLKDLEIVRKLSIPINLVKDLLNSGYLSKIEEVFLEINRQFLPQPLISSETYQELLKLNKTKILIRDIGKNTINEVEVNSLDTPEKFINRIEEYLKKKGSDFLKIKDYCLNLFKIIIEPNLSYNADITLKFKQEAEGRIKPVYKEIDLKKNELILAKGQRVTSREMRIIEEINRALGKGDSLYNFLSIGILILIIFILAQVYLYKYENKVYTNLNELVFIQTIILISLLVTRIFYNKGIDYSLIPLPAVAMLISLLLGGRIAIKINVFLAMVITFLLELNFKYTVIFLISGMVGALLVEKARKRAHVLKGGLGVSLIQFVSLWAWGILEEFNFLSPLKGASLGLLNGIISAFIALGSLSFFEYIFHLTSNITLLELSDHNHPLLKELILKAPGTYHHSLIVGNLAEAACEAIGANSLLARVGAYYHDIGKIEKAEYFSENQPHPYSKHIKLTPELSSLVIINHVKEGVEKAKKYRLSRRVIDIIAQHHGTSKVYYFYQRALLRGVEEKEIDESRFCYPGPLPQTNEAAVVLLADSVEAASRTLEETTPSSVRNLVKRILNNKFVEGQLNECNLTLQDLNKISECFTNILLSILHTRIKYPEIKQNGDRGNQINQTGNTLTNSRNKEKDH